MELTALHACGPQITHSLSGSLQDISLMLMWVSYRDIWEIICKLWVKNEQIMSNYYEASGSNVKVFFTTLPFSANLLFPNWLIILSQLIILWDSAYLSFSETQPTYHSLRLSQLIILSRFSGDVPFFADISCSYHSSNFSTHFYFQCVQFHPNTNYVATGSTDRSVRLWDVQHGDCVRIFTGHKVRLWWWWG